MFGHEPAIAEYVIMTMLVLSHRLFEAVTAFRKGSWVASPQFGCMPTGIGQIHERRYRTALVISRKPIEFWAVSEPPGLPVDHKL